MNGLINMADSPWPRKGDAAATTANRREEEANLKANDARAGIREKVDSVHEAVNDRIDAHKEAERQRTRTA